MPMKDLINLIFQLRVGIWWGGVSKCFSCTSYVALQERAVNIRDHQGVGRTQTIKTKFAGHRG